MGGGPVHNSLERFWEGEWTTWRKSVIDTNNNNHNNNNYSRKTRELFENVQAFGDMEIELSGKKTRRADCSYQYVDSKYEQPSLLIEVMWYQSIKDMREKVNDYIYGSDGHIATVVGINLSGTYKLWSEIKQRWDPKSGANNRGPINIIIWRAATNVKGELVIEESEPVVVCGEDRAVSPAQRIGLNLGDVFSETGTSSAMSQRERADLRNVEMSLNWEELVKNIDKALKLQKAQDDRKDGSKVSNNNGGRRRGRPRKEKEKDKIREGQDKRVQNQTKTGKSQESVNVGGRALRWLSGRREGGT